MTDKDKIHVHLDPAEQNPAIPEIGPDVCPDCRVPCEAEFGLAGGGYGGYTYCPQCYRILSKTQEHDD